MNHDDWDALNKLAHSISFDALFNIEGLDFAMFTIEGLILKVWTPRIVCPEEWKSQSLLAEKANAFAHKERTRM